MGKVVTFYSYKGGVGRSMALANVAAALARWRFRVLVVDWDFEAPGIETFFLPWLQKRTDEGLVDLLVRQSRWGTSSESWRDLILRINMGHDYAPIDLLSAGARNREYWNRVREFDVDAFYNKSRGGEFIENLRDEWKRNYDFILVDSRTGITDIGGICTVQLPDILIILIPPTRQALDGSAEVIERIKKARDNLLYDRARLPILTIPSRFDSQTEFKAARHWLSEFSKVFSSNMSEWLPASVQRLAFLEAVKIPYVPYFSYGEKLAIVEQGTTDPAGLGYAYETLAALVAGDLAAPELAITDHEELIRSAFKRETRHTRLTLILNLPAEETRDFAGMMMGAAGATEAQVWSEWRVKEASNGLREFSRSVETSDAIIVLINDALYETPFYQDPEIGAVFQQAQDKAIPLFLFGREGARPPSWAANVPVRHLEGLSIPIALADRDEIQQRIQRRRQGRMSPPGSPPDARYADLARLELERYTDAPMLDRSQHAFRTALRAFEAQRLQEAYFLLGEAIELEGRAVIRQVLLVLYGGDRQAFSHDFSLALRRPPPVIAEERDEFAQMPLQKIIDILSGWNQRSRFSQNLTFPTDVAGALLRWAETRNAIAHPQSRALSQRSFFANFVDALEFAATCAEYRWFLEALDKHDSISFRSTNELRRWKDALGLQRVILPGPLGPTLDEF